MKRKVIGGALLAGMTFCGAPPADAADPPSSREVPIVCELNLNEEAVRSEVPSGLHSSYLTPVFTEEGKIGSAVKKCTESRQSQTQSITCSRVFPIANAADFETKDFECVMLSCEDETTPVKAKNQTFKITPITAEMAEVSIFCQASFKKK